MAERYTEDQLRALADLVKNQRASMKSVLDMAMRLGTAGRPENEDARFEENALRHFEGSIRGRNSLY